MDTSLTEAGYAGPAEPEFLGTPLLPGVHNAQATLSPPGIHAGPDPVIYRPHPSAADDHPSEYADEPRRRPRGPVTVPQRIGAILLAGACVAGVAWYVPRVVNADSHTFTGTVTSSGMSDLNFAGSGRIGSVQTHLGQDVRRGQVLATETSSSTIAVLRADRAAIAAELAALHQLRANPTSNHANIAAVNALLARDRAQLASDRVRLVGTEILAPAAGTVVAINGQAGETVSANGVHNYSAQAPSSATQQPAFSLLPQGPRSSLVGNATASVLPMISLRTSGDWLVKVLVPQSAAATVHPGQRAMISVPAVKLANVKGFVQELSPTPVNTSNGLAYQVAIAIVGHRRVTPMSGMTANVQLGS